MRAWQLDDLGDPLEKLQLNEIADAPEPMAGQVTVSIKAVGISFPDVLQCRGEYQVKPALPWIPGGESAGIVSSVGPEVTTLEIGDRVMMLGGGLVDQVNVHEMGVWKVPESFALDKAAAVPVNYGTTWTHPWCKPCRLAYPKEYEDRCADALETSERRVSYQKYNRVQWTPPEGRPKAWRSKHRPNRMEPREPKRYI